MVALLERAEEIYADANRMVDPTFGINVPAVYYAWLGPLYGKVAVVLPEYLPKALENEANLTTYYENTVDQYGNRYPIIATNLPFAYSSMAKSLYEIGGEERHEEVRLRLDMIMQIIAEDPALHAGQFLARVREVGGQPESLATEHHHFLNMAELHPPFKAFLEQYGWSFTQ